MKFLFPLFAVLCGASVAQSQISERASQEASQEASAAAAAAAAAQQLLLSMPKCGLACLEGAVAASPCSATDISCSCRNATLQAEVSVCVAQSCSLREALSTKNSSVTLCQQPVRDQSQPIIYIALVGLGIAVLAIILRMAGRAVAAGGFIFNTGLDDYAILLALVLIGGISACAFILAHNGLGKDIWTVKPHSITTLLHIYYVDEILYIITLPLIKVSIILTYQRIFREKAFRWLAYAAIGLNACYVVAFGLVTTFQCKPIKYAWLRWDKEHEGTCMDLGPQVMAAAAFNIVLDLVVVAMPMPFLWRLQMSTRKKIMVMLMFSGGLFVVVVSILRLQFLISFADSQNLTWDYREIGNWSVVEMDASVLCACLPGIRQLQKVVWPRLIASTTLRSNDKSSKGDVYHRSSVSASGIVADSKGRSKVHNNFIPLEDRDWDAEGHKSAAQSSTSDLVAK